MAAWQGRTHFRKATEMNRSLATGFLFMVTFLVACGGGGNDTTTGNGDAVAPTTVPTASETAAGSGSNVPGPSGSGSGTLVVDGSTFEFSVIFCGFTPEETRNATVPFSLRGTGVYEGRPFTVDGSISAIALGATVNTTHTLFVSYDDNSDQAVYGNGVPGVPESGEFVLNGKDVSFEAPFSDAGGASVGTGTMDATCP
jgi:hypothetical protein